jgi:hypothetical protein
MQDYRDQAELIEVLDDLHPDGFISPMNHENSIWSLRLLVLRLSGNGSYHLRLGLSLGFGLGRL